MLLLASILLIVAAVAAILAPLVQGTSAALSDGPDLEAQVAELQALKSILYETIRDLEYDFHAGKIGEADFHELSARSKREAMAIVQRLDALRASLPSRPRGPERAGP